MHYKTILIPINQGISYRYILQTDIIKELQKKAKKIIILVPEPTDPFYGSIKSFKNVIKGLYKIDQQKYKNRYTDIVNKVVKDNVESFIERC